MLGYLIGATAVVTAASAVGYQSMAPTGQWFGRTFIGAGRPSMQLALTYDDGPNDPYTARLLEVLAKHNVHATFFLIGSFVQQRPDIAREVVGAGHVVGNHTVTHPALTFKSNHEVRKELGGCERALTDAVGQHSNLFRPPFGARRPAVLRIARQMGLEPVMWNVTGYDWSAPSVEHIEQKVTSKVRGGDVILLHDGRHRAFGTDRSYTVMATDRLITRYKSEGYEFVTIAEMMKRNTHVGPGL
ncbi:MAG TPA: polysaccharide deacetylase family protein [Terriglobales bacterium]|nr:polysaccharide deacetylase family protein [Terriglobales bacterium]